MKQLDIGTTWQFRYQSQGQNAKFSLEDYKNSFVLLIEFNEVSQFLNNFQFILPASQLQAGSGYSIMKQNVLPMYEDKRHLNNSYKRIRLDASAENINLLWNKLIQCVLQKKLNDPCFSGIEVRKKEEDQFCAVWIVGTQEEIAQGEKCLYEMLDQSTNVKKE